MASLEQTNVVRRVLAKRPPAYFDAPVSAVRSRLVDDCVQRALVEDRIDTVINLAAGLDARVHRLKLPDNLTWIDVGRPNTLADQAEVLRALPPRCHYRAQLLDLTQEEARQRFFTKVSASSRSALVITEGLLMCLPADTVSGLARELSGCPPIKRWVTDLLSSQEVEEINDRFGGRLRAANAQVQFGLADPQAFFYPLGWQPTRFYSCFLEARRLHQEPVAVRWRRWLAPLASRQLRERWRCRYGVLVLRRNGGI